MPNLVHFQDLGALYALLRAPNFYEIHPKTGSSEFLIG
jgi:hypothetical protein